MKITSDNEEKEKCFNFDKIVLPRERHTHKLKGYAFVSFVDMFEAIVAKEILNDSTFITIQTNPVRVALIGDRDEKSDLLIRNVP